MIVIVNTAEYPDDVSRIQKVLADRDLEATLKECEEMWQKYSDSMAASWMILPRKDEDVFNIISSYIENAGS